MQIGSSNGVYGTGILDEPSQNGRARPQDPFRDTKANSDFVQTSWLHLSPAGNESKLTYSYTAHDSFDPNICIISDVCQGKFAGTPAYSGFTKLAVKASRNDLELQNTTQLGDSNRLVWGGNVRSDYADYPLVAGEAPYHQHLAGVCA